MHSFLDFVHPDDKEKYTKGNWDDSRRLQTEFKNRWVCKDDSIKWLVWSAIAEPATGLMYAVARDITELVKLEKEQQEND
jgi:hypothetical protein